MSVTQKHYLAAANLVVLGFVVWSGVSLGLSVFSQRLENRIIDQAPVRAGSSSAPKLRTLAHYEAIAQKNIFGGASQQSAGAPENDEAIPAQTSSGDYRLRGTILGASDESSFAILENIKSKEQDLYRPGDAVGSAELVSVSADAITVRQSGKLVRIEIFGEDDGKPLPFSSKPAALPKTTAASPKDAGTIAEEVAPNKFVVSRDSLNQHMANLNSFLSQVRIVPFFKDGKPYGFKLASVRQDSPVAKLGIERGDIITQVNGISVEKPEDLMNLYRQVQQLDSVTLELEREGSPVTLNYSLR